MNALIPDLSANPVTGPVPGVVWQDVRPAPPGVLLTGVPALIGVARPREDGATGVACYVGHRLTVWAQFESLVARLGPPPHAGSESVGAGHLPAAVRGFFDNGGQVAYVVWVDAADDPLPGLRRALAALDDLTEVDLVAVPDLFGAAVWPPAVGLGAGLLGGGLPGGGVPGGGEAHDLASVVALQRAVLEHCEARGTGSRYWTAFHRSRSRTS